MTMEAATTTAGPRERACVVRIELSPARRRHLGDLAREAGVAADELAARLLSELLDDGRKSEWRPAQRKARVKRTIEPPVAANGIVVDFASLNVTHRDRAVALTFRQAQLVVTLVRAMPRVVSRATLAAAAWPDLNAKSRASYITDIRRSLARRLAQIGLQLETEYGEGLRLIPSEEGNP